MMIIWWSKHVGEILSVLMCDIWINVLLQTSTLVGPLYIVKWNARWNSEIYPCLSMNYKYLPWSFVIRYVAFITNEWTVKNSHKGQMCYRELRNAEVWMQLIGKEIKYIQFLVKMLINTVRWITINILVMWWKQLCRTRKWICKEITAAWGDWTTFHISSPCSKISLWRKYWWK
jgi:hypothetical protein